jgi:NAD(P)-dependent dehydrogenase (short-subunit alcohol dehydrogenase family)
MAGKVALITGGSSGIGRSAGLLLAREGAQVVVAARRMDEGEQTAQMIRNAGGEASVVRAEVSKVAEVQALVNLCVERYGRLDYAVNNAAIEGSMVPLIDYSEEDWDAVIDINLKGTWLCMKYEIIQKSGGGAIVNISSVGGLIGFPRMGPYVATKHGIIGLTKTRRPRICRPQHPGHCDLSWADRYPHGRSFYYRHECGGNRCGKYRLLAHAPEAARDAR